MMTQDEMRLAVCEKLPEVIEVDNHTFCHTTIWWMFRDEQVHWPTEGLQVAHEAEKLLNQRERSEYCLQIALLVHYTSNRERTWKRTHTTYEQRLEALCRVWWPERFVKGQT